MIDTKSPKAKLALAAQGRRRPASDIRAWLVACLACLAAAAEARAQSPAAGAATPQEGSYSGLLPPDRNEIAEQEHVTWTVNKIPLQQNMKEIYWDFPTETPAFFRDTLIQVVGRTYDLTRDNANGSKSSAWAGGGWIVYRSGLIGDIFGVQGAFYTAQPLIAPNDEGGSKLLTANQNALNVFGQAYARAQIADQELRGGRQLVNTPLINAQDNRMVPNTFEGVTLDTLPDKGRSYEYALGYLTAIKQRNSNKFISMSDALAGGNTTDRGASFGMLKYKVTPQLSATVMDYYLPDFVNSGFVQGEYDFKLPKEVPNWVLGANVITQQSVGQDRLTGSSFHTFQASMKVQMAYAGWTAFVAGSSTGDGSKIFSPFGTKPNYTDMQQVSFDNAGEKALGVSAAYDFGYAFEQYGLAGLSAGVWDTQGWGAAAHIPDRNELNAWLQYRPGSGPFQGFRFKTQYSDVWQSGNARNPQPELRVILDYTILFRPPLAN